MRVPRHYSQLYIRVPTEGRRGRALRLFSRFVRGAAAVCVGEWRQRGAVCISHACARGKGARPEQADLRRQPARRRVLSRRRVTYANFSYAPTCRGKLGATGRLLGHHRQRGDRGIQPKQPTQVIFVVRAVTTDLQHMPSCCIKGGRSICCIKGGRSTCVQDESIYEYTIFLTFRCASRNLSRWASSRCHS